MRKLFLIILTLMTFEGVAQTDSLKGLPVEVHLKDGTKVEGTFWSSSESKLTIKYDNDLHDLYAADILEIEGPRIATDSTTNFEDQVEQSTATNDSIQHSSDYYSYSYETGRKYAAIHENSLGWGVGSYFMSFFTLNLFSTAVPLMADTREITPKVRVTNVDKELYTAGYIDETKRKRKNAAIKGSLVSGLTWLIIFITSIG